MAMLGSKVFAESDPAEKDENPENDEDGDEITVMIPFIEGQAPDDNCFCICFCPEKAKDDSDPEEDEDLVDPQDELKDHCREKKDCQALKEKFEECTARVESKSKTSETCAEELIDFLHCVDHCVAKTLFTKLK